MTSTLPDSPSSPPIQTPAAPVWVAPTPIASVRHTILLLAILIGNSAAGAFIQHPLFPKVHLSGSVVYLIGSAIEWLLLGFVLYGIRNSGVGMKDLIQPVVAGINPSQIKRRQSSLFRDFWIAVGFLFVQSIVLGLLGALIHRPPNLPNDPSNPHGAAEMICYLLVCVSAGVCEEIIFRGYLQRQFAAFTASPSRAVILQAIVFGASHGYQGIKLMFLIAVGGWLAGLLARWRGSLRPGIIAHFLEDILAGIVAPRLLN